MADTVKTQLTYAVFPTDGSKPYQYIVAADVPAGVAKTNITKEQFEVEIENIRGKEDSYTLDVSGFQYARDEAKHKTFANDEEVKREYYPESIELVKKLTGASRVELFDHTIRRRRPGQPHTSPTTRQPVSLAHVDQTRGAAITRVHRHLPAEDAAELLKKRFQIINIWRPISHPALDYPLSVCDFRSVNSERDLVPTTMKYADRDGETFSVRYSPEHKWKYLRGMRTDEVLLFKCFDSVDDGSVAVLTPHTAFVDPSTPADAPLRESIELRALVFYD